MKSIGLRHVFQTHVFISCICLTLENIFNSKTSRLDNTDDNIPAFSRISTVRLWMVVLEIQIKFSTIFWSYLVYKCLRQ